MKKQLGEENIALFSPDEADMIRRVRDRLGIGTNRAVIVRCVRTIDQIMDHQDGNGQVLLCKKGMPDKVVWFV